VYITSDGGITENEELANAELRTYITSLLKNNYILYTFSTIKKLKEKEKKVCITHLIELGRI